MAHSLEYSLSPAIDIDGTLATAGIPVSDEELVLMCGKVHRAKIS
jgi:hypothetical protein